MPGFPVSGDAARRNSVSTRRVDSGQTQGEVYFTKDKLRTTKRLSLQV